MSFARNRFDIQQYNFKTNLLTLLAVKMSFNIDDEVSTVLKAAWQREEQWRKLSLLNFEMNNLLHLPRAVELRATTN